MAAARAAQHILGAAGQRLGALARVCCLRDQPEMTGLLVRLRGLRRQDQSLDRLE